MKYKVPAQRLSLLSKRCFYFGLLLFLVLSFMLTTSHIGYAQFPLPEGADQSSQVERPRTVDRYGNFETAPVTSPLDGKTLFTIASPALKNGNADAPNPSQPVEERAKEVNERAKEKIACGLPRQAAMQN